jgi:hypothetical protein
MLAKIICFLLGHITEELDVLDTVEPNVYIRRGKCDRCGAPVFEMYDLREE